MAWPPFLPVLSERDVVGRIRINNDHPSATCLLPLSRLLRRRRRRRRLYRAKVAGRFHRAVHYSPASPPRRFGCRCRQRGNVAADARRGHGTAHRGGGGNDGDDGDGDGDDYDDDWLGQSRSRMTGVGRGDGRRLARPPKWTRRRRRVSSHETDATDTLGTDAPGRSALGTSGRCIRMWWRRKSSRWIE
jgi:hypothetical protein